MGRVRRGDGTAERRASKRFGIEQELAYRVLGSRVEAQSTGSGRTINFSSTGLLFRNLGSPLIAGTRLEMSIVWPALLSGSCPLKLVALGRVLRADDTTVAFKIEQYEFRTRRSGQIVARERSSASASTAPARGGIS